MRAASPPWDRQRRVALRAGLLPFLDPDLQPHRTETFKLSRDPASQDGNLGAASGSLTFGGGTLETTASFSSARNITLNTAGNVQTDIRRHRHRQK